MLEKQNLIFLCSWNLKETEEGILRQLFRQLGDILFAPKFQSSVTISEEAPGSRSLGFTISQDGGQVVPNLVPLWSVHIIIIVLEIHYSPDDGAEEFV